MWTLPEPSTASGSWGTYFGSVSKVVAVILHSVLSVPAILFVFGLLRFGVLNQRRMNLKAGE